MFSHINKTEKFFRQYMDLICQLHCYYGIFKTHLSEDFVRNYNMIIDQNENIFIDHNLNCHE